MMSATAPSSDRVLILCIEDEDDLRRDIVEELCEAGYEAIEARNGAEALAVLERLRPDLILCDISMPGLDGYDILKTVQADASGRADIPFVFLSALADPRQVVEGKRLGADDYLVKPIDYDLLLATVHARLRQIARIRSADAGKGRSLNAQEITASYGLTPAETRIAIALSEGKHLNQIATQYEISRATVAFHMRNIFQKTGTNRQAELVAVLLAPSEDP